MVFTYLNLALDFGTKKGPLCDANSQILVPDDIIKQVEEKNVSRYLSFSFVAIKELKNF